MTNLGYRLAISPIHFSSLSIDDALLNPPSLVLHIPVTHIAEATAPAAETLHASSQAHTFLEIKNDTRRPSLLSRYGGTPEDDERLFRVTPYVKLIGPVLKKEKKKIGPVLVGKTPFFKEYLKGHLYNRNDLVVSHVLETMETEKMTEEVNTFRRKDTFLADEFIEDYGIEAVATAIVNAKHSANENTKTNGQTLLDDLLTSLDKTAKGNYQNVFDRLKLNEQKVGGFFAGRVELLDDLIKSHHGGQPNDQELFTTLSVGLKGHDKLAEIIGFLAEKSEAAQRLETRYIKYWVDVLKIDTLDIIRWLGLKGFGYVMFRRPEFKMAEKFLLLKGVAESEIRQTMLKALLKAHFDSETLLAVVIAKGYEMGDSGSAMYRSLFFEYLREKKYNPDYFANMFYEYVFKQNPSAREFVKDYRSWYPTPAGKKKLQLISRRLLHQTFYIYPVQMDALGSLNRSTINERDSVALS